ncbi:MAG: hypothetical protein GX044_03145 [Firmicutes bacterium]|nr:hypothetical protein [Bacillota bacterium]
MKKIAANALRICLVLAVGLILILYLVKLPGSSAYFTDRVESDPITLQF